MNQTLSRRQLYRQGKKERKLMSEQRDERDKQTMGRYEVLMHGQDVVLVHCDFKSARILTPAEALMLLAWLSEHRDDLDKAARMQKKAH